MPLAHGCISCQHGCNYLSSRRLKLEHVSKMPLPLAHGCISCQRECLFNSFVTTSTWRSKLRFSSPLWLKSIDHKRISFTKVRQCRKSFHARKSSWAKQHWQARLAKVLSLLNGWLGPLSVSNCWTAVTIVTPQMIRKHQKLKKKTSINEKRWYVPYIHRWI